MLLGKNLNRNTMSLTNMSDSVCRSSIARDVEIVLMAGLYLTRQNRSDVNNVCRHHVNAAVTSAINCSKGENRPDIRIQTLIPNLLTTLMTKKVKVQFDVSSH